MGDNVQNLEISPGRGDFEGWWLGGDDWPPPPRKSYGTIAYMALLTVAVLATIGYLYVERDSAGGVPKAITYPSAIEVMAELVQNHEDISEYRASINPVFAGPELDWIDRAAAGGALFAIYHQVCFSGAVSDNGETYYFGNLQNEVYKASTSGKLTFLLELDTMPTTMNALQDGGLLVGAESGEFIHLDADGLPTRQMIEGGSITKSWPGGNSTVAYAYTHKTGKVWLADFATGNSTIIGTADRVFTAPSSPGWAMLVDDQVNTTRITVVNPDFEVALRDSFSPDDLPSAIDIHLDTRILAIGTGGGGVRIYSLDRGEQTKQMWMKDRGVTTVSSVVIGPYEKRIFAATTTHMVVFNSNVGIELAAFATDRNLPPFDMKWNPGIADLSVIDQTGAMLWRAQPQEERRKASPL